MIAPNTILQDRYRIVRLLGKGGMGAVYEAIDQRVSCVVALKEYTVGQTDARQAFQREAALLANLRHSALPKVMDYFDDAHGDFLVMEYIPGLDLAEMMALRGGPFPPEQVVRWAIELLKLLEYLHTREPPILHRDVKPANLKVTKQDEVFLLDFGLAKGSAGQMATMETSRSVAGYTPVYAPIEQILGQGTDPRSDLYSLGATLYHLLTGEAPVSAPARFDAVENDRPDPLSSASKLNSLVAPDIATLVQHAMALSRKDRPSSASAMRIALQVAADRAVRDQAEANLIKTLPYPPEIDPAKPLPTDNDVQFTVYTPQTIKPVKEYAVLAFAHLSKRRADAPEDEPDPIEQMKDQAARVLGIQRDDYGEVKDSSRQPVPRGGELTFVPVIPGITFSPPSRSFTWRKSIHREEFDMSAASETDGQTLKGRMTVFLGSIILAEVGLTIAVDSHAIPSAEKISLDAGRSARRLRQVFASYSQKDEQVVAELAQVAPMFDAAYLTDRTHLLPGEDRREGSQRLIRNADVFQLFWSTNSMRSVEIANELNYAISLGRPGFILPTYWEEPVPRSPAEGLPPQEIDRLHFYRIYPGAISRATLAVVNESQRTAPAVVTGSLGLPRDETPLKAIPPETIRSSTPEALNTGSLELPRSYTPPGQLPPLETMRTPVPPMVPFFPASDPMMVAPGVVTSPPNSSPSPAYLPAARAPRKKKLWLPIFGVAAMVLFVAVLAPIWFMMSGSNSTYDTKTPSANNTNAAPLNASNSSGNVNNDSAPLGDVQFSRLDGGTMRLKDFQGRVVLLNFWATWCVPCRTQVAILNELQKDFEPRGLNVIGVAREETANSVRQFQKETPQNYQVGFSSQEVESQFLSTSLPVTYVIDRRGRIRKKMIGQQTRAALDAVIEPLINESP